MRLPEDIPASASEGVIQKADSTSRGSGSGSHPSGAGATKNRASKRTGAPSGVTHEPAETNRSVRSLIPASRQACRNADGSLASERIPGSNSPVASRSPTSS
jgi:hypothetical protein